jgi:hypothetical protein
LIGFHEVDGEKGEILGVGMSCCGQILGTISTDYSIQFHDISEIDKQPRFREVEEEEKIEEEDEE